eukprot:m51a1_g5082 hypothetical protein (168) ;mRNA; f:240612-241589
MASTPSVFSEAARSAEIKASPQDRRLVEEAKDGMKACLRRMTPRQTLLFLAFCEETLRAYEHLAPSPAVATPTAGTPSPSESEIARSQPLPSLSPPDAVKTPTRAIPAPLALPSLANVALPSPTGFPKQERYPSPRELQGAYGLPPFVLAAPEPSHEEPAPKRIRIL